MSREELLLYFFLVSAANEQGCSWWSTRQITKVLKVGPATMIKARQMLEERNLIATRKDDLSGRTVYQVLSLPIDENIRIEIPMKKNLRKRGRPDAEKSREDIAGQSGAGAASEDAHQTGQKFLDEIQAMLRQS
jgi:hypothetical protein